MKRSFIILSLLLCSLICGAQGSEGIATAILDGRTIVKEAPKLTTPGTIDGIVVVSIDVDASGAVISATSGAEGTTLSNQSILNATRASALKARFNTEDTATGLQKGTITYCFTSFDYPQTKESVLKFLGIPVDGTVENMKKALADKGFGPHFMFNYWVGIFDGENVALYINENHNKVDKISVNFHMRTDDNEIQVKYNTLLSRFDRNSKYVSIVPREPLEDRYISRSDNHDAVYFFLHPKANPEQWRQDFLTEYQTRFSRELSSLRYEELEETLFCMSPRVSAAVCGIVWFTIDEHRNLYLHYINIKNRPHGEDL